MTVLRLNLHLWKLKGLFEADMTQFFHPKFCSCIMLENQKSWNQSFETVLKIDLHLINLRWQNYFSSFSRPQWKNMFFFPRFSSPIFGLFSSFYSYSSYSNQREHLGIYIWLSANSNFFMVFKVCTVCRKLL